MLIVGSTLTFSTKLYDRDPADGGVLVDAEDIALDIYDPDDVLVSSPVVTNPPVDTGVYLYNFTPTVSVGTYKGIWSFTMAGGVVAKYSEQFEVTAEDPKWIISLSKAKRHLNIPATDTRDDEEISDWLAGITRVIEHRVGACIPRTVIEYAEGGGNVIRTDQSPVMELVSIVPYLSAGYTYIPGQLRVTPEGRIRLLTAREFFYGPYEITYVVGRRPVPANILQAAKIILKHLWDTQRGAAGLPLQGDMDLVTVPGLGFAVPNRALELLEPDSEGPAIG